MAHPLNEMLEGMAAHFAADGDVAGRLQARLYRGMSAERARAHESPSSEVPSPLLEFAEYELAPAERGLVHNSKRSLIVAAIEWRWFAELAAGAAEMFDLFDAALVAGSSSSTGRYHGTWNGRTILGARWDESTLSEGRDDAIAMAQLTCTLIVPFVAR